MTTAPTGIFYKEIAPDDRDLANKEPRYCVYEEGRTDDRGQLYCHGSYLTGEQADALICNLIRLKSQDRYGLTEGDWNQIRASVAAIEASGTTGLVPRVFLALNRMKEEIDQRDERDADAAADRSFEDGKYDGRE
jgi:hypothetical protein